MTVTLSEPDLSNVLTALGVAAISMDETDCAEDCDGRCAACEWGHTFASTLDRISQQLHADGPRTTPPKTARPVSHGPG
jgi:hypothetical protein